MPAEPAGAQTADDGGRATRAARSARNALRSPELATEGVQLLKAVLAATAAWWLSVNVLHSPMPFLAPWTALLTVHATVYRSLARGVETIVASSLGVGLSFVIGQLLGVNVWTFALALLVGLISSQLRWLRHEGVAIATTAIFILGSGYTEEQPYLDDRLIEVALGVALGIVANLALIPPLRDQQASRYVDSLNRRMGDVLISMGDEFGATWDTDRAEAWLAEARSMGDELDTAWQSVRFARESSRLNPRRRVGSPRNRRDTDEGGTERVGYEDILLRVGEGISHLRHLARTLREATYAAGEWDDDFRAAWAAIVRDAGRAIADPDADVEPIQDRLDALASRFGDESGMPRRHWPVYGSLITSMLHIAVIVDDVASARAAREEDSKNPQA